MQNSDATGWSTSAHAWIREMGEHGDFSRTFVLDEPMMVRVRHHMPRNALDVGCGEGRFCRMMIDNGIEAVGVDPTEVLIRTARERNPTGDYQVGVAEKLDFPNASFDLVVSYMTLLNIADVRTAISEMVRVLRPSGRLLIANLSSFVTAGLNSDGLFSRFPTSSYSEVSVKRVAWNGLNVDNWHRPFEMYFRLLIDEGLELRHFAEPLPIGSDTFLIDQFRRYPGFVIMEWQKPDGRQLSDNSARP